MLSSPVKKVGLSQADRELLHCRQLTADLLRRSRLPVLSVFRAIKHEPLFEKIEQGADDCGNGDYQQIVFIDK